MRVTRASARRQERVKEVEKPSESIPRAEAASPQRPRTAPQTRSGTAAREANEPSSPPNQTRPLGRSQWAGNIRPARRGIKLRDTRSLASISTNPVRDSDDGNGGSSEDDDAREEDGAEEEDAEQATDDIVSQLQVQPSGSEEASTFDQDTLNSDMMIKSRKYLYSATCHLYDHLCLEGGDPTWDNLLRTLHGVFNKWKAHYSTTTHFLDRALINKSLEDQKSEDSEAVSHVVSAANLVILRYSIHQVRAGREELLHLLQKIDEDFPWCIMAPESATTDSYEKHDTFERALGIRISLWILRVLTIEDCTPETAMKIGGELIFGDVAGDYTVYPMEKDSKTVKFRPIYGDDFETPRNKDKPHATMRKRIFRAFDHVRGVIINQEGFHPESLIDAFSIEECLDELARWAESLFGAVRRTIETETARPTIDNPENADRQQRHETLYTGRDAVLSLGAAKEGGNGQNITARNTGSGKRIRYEDAGGDDVYDFTASPAHKRPKARVVRTRPAQETEPTGADRQNHQNSGDAPRGTDEAAERQPLSMGSETDQRASRKPQTRVPWDKHDENVLKYWVGLHGSFWSHMEKEERKRKDGEKMLNVERTEQQLRDKARNMKVAMLRDDEILPKNFNDVWLSAKEKSLLKKLGKNPYRREEDVVDGRPVNTEYVPSDDEDEE